MEVLVVVQDPAGYRAAIDGWRRTATVTQELPPQLALASPRGEVPDVPGTRWYTGAVPQDVLLTLEPSGRIFVAAWLDRLGPRQRPGDGPAWADRGYVQPGPPADGPTGGDA